MRAYEPVGELGFPRRPGCEYLCHFGAVWEWAASGNDPAAARCRRIGSYPRGDELRHEYILDGGGRLLRAERIGGPPPTAWRMEVAQALGMSWRGFDTECLGGPEDLGLLLIFTLSLVDEWTDLELSVRLIDGKLVAHVAPGGRSPTTFAVAGTSDFVDIAVFVPGLNRVVRAGAAAGQFAWNTLVDDQGAYVLYGTGMQIEAARAQGLRLESR